MQIRFLYIISLDGSLQYHFVFFRSQKQVMLYILILQVHCCSSLLSPDILVSVCGYLGIPVH